MGNYQPKKGVQSKEDGINIFYVKRDCKINLSFYYNYITNQNIFGQKGKKPPYYK